MSMYSIKQPIVTERSLQLANCSNIYTFAVEKSATKHQIHQAIEELYDVDVVKVRTITQQARQKRTGRRRLTVSTAKSKKALVWLKEGQTIEAFAVTAA